VNDFVLDPDFEPRIADWLEDDPDRAPDAVLETVLAAFPSIPQRRAVRVPWRPIPMNRLMVFGAAALAVLIGGSIVVLRPGTLPATTPSLAPSASASSAASPSASDSAGWTGNLTRTFTSPLYGYSIATDPSWTTTPATVPIDDPASTDRTAYDAIRVTGTDTTIGAAAEPIGRATFEQYLASQHEAVKTGDAPADCKGLDPGRWPPRSVGDREGRVMVLCNYEVVFVQSGDRVYQFTWSHESFNVSKHLSEADFAHVLVTVRFDARPAPSGSEPAPSASSGVPAMTERVTSPSGNFTIRYPSGWTSQLSTEGAPGSIGAELRPESGTLPNAFFSGSAVKLPVGQPPAQWLAAQPGMCTDPSTGNVRQPVEIGGVEGLLIDDGCPILGGRWHYLAVVVVAGRGYTFHMDSRITPIGDAWFSAMLTAVSFEP
jgi:hypothetical protein